MTTPGLMTTPALTSQEDTRRRNRMIRSRSGVRHRPDPSACHPSRGLPPIRTADLPSKRSRLCLVNVTVLGVAHLLALVAVAYMIFVRTDSRTLLLALGLTIVVGLSVTGGYHRLFAHRTHRAARPLQALYLLFGTAAVQNSALRWATDHRVHHAHTDTEHDPYSVRRGFWWAHVGWVLMNSGPPRVPDADLEQNRLVALQHRFYVPLALFFVVILPTAIASLWGDALGGLLVAGFLRLVLQWHATFSVNSLAHLVGRRPYGTTTTARDSMLTALISFGEGYHSFHHRFMSDYRNGLHWWQFDPTKWFVWTMSHVGLTSDLRRTPMEAIRRAREEAAAR
jgi:stearoyl-CoA desaturase (delta-9 desaturase)